MPHARSAEPKTRREGREPSRGSGGATGEGHSSASAGLEDRPGGAGPRSLDRGRSRAGVAGTGSRGQGRGLLRPGGSDCQPRTQPRAGAGASGGGRRNREGSAELRPPQLSLALTLQGFETPSEALRPEPTRRF